MNYQIGFNDYRISKMRADLNFEYDFGSNDTIGMIATW